MSKLFHLSHSMFRLFVQLAKKLFISDMLGPYLATEKKNTPYVISERRETCSNAEVSVSEYGFPFTKFVTCHFNPLLITTDFVF